MDFAVDLAANIAVKNIIFQSFCTCVTLNSFRELLVDISTIKYICSNAETRSAVIPI